MILLALPGVVSAAELSVAGNILFGPDLVVTVIEPNLGAGGFMFANEPNVISVTVKNQGDDNALASTLSVDVGGNVYTTTVGTLAADASSTVTVNDIISRPFGTPVTITATADSGGVIDEGNEANNQTTSILPVYFNGFKGKRWTSGGDLNTHSTWPVPETYRGPITIRGNVIYSAGNTMANDPGWTTKTYIWSKDDLRPMDFPRDMVFRVLLYQGYYDNQMAPGVFPTYTMSFNGNTVVPWKTYHDQKSFEPGNFPSGVYVYNVTPYFNPYGYPWEESMTITPEAGANYGIYGAYLVVIYMDRTTTEKWIWINDNFDILYAKSTHSVSSDEATAYAPFERVDTTTNVAKAQAIAILSGADEAGRSKFYFNTNEYTGFWSNYMAGPGIGFSVYDVTGALAPVINEARLQSFDSGSGGDNMNAMTTILIVEKTEVPVDARFSATPLSGDKPLTVTFHDESTGYIRPPTYPDMTTGWTWSFGDGQTSTEQNPTHEYTTRGKYTVSLTVTGVGEGNTDTETKTEYITVKEKAPVIDFTGSQTSGKRPLSVDFTATNTGGQVDSWVWDFGDGGTSTLQNPTHVYQNEGTYAVCLTAIGPDYADVEIKENYINVEQPTIDIILNPASINFGTMAAGVDETGSTTVNADVTGGTTWSVKVADTKTTNKGSMETISHIALANPFQLSKDETNFYPMTSDFTDFLTGSAGVDGSGTAYVKQAIAAADAPGAYAITLTFIYSFD